MYSFMTLITFLCPGKKRVVMVCFEAFRRALRLLVVLAIVLPLASHLLDLRASAARIGTMAAERRVACRGRKGPDIGFLLWLPPRCYGEIARRVYGIDSSEVIPRTTLPTENCKGCPGDTKACKSYGSWGLAPAWWALRVGQLSNSLGSLEARLRAAAPGGLRGLGLEECS